MIKTVTHKQLEPVFGDSKLLEKAATTSFSDMIFEMFSGCAPTQSQSRIFEYILVTSIDHGPDTPSAQKTIQSANEGNPISQSVSRGIEQINDAHGGAIEPAMELFYQIKKSQKNITETVKEFNSQNKKIPGFGHRLYTVDPRAEAILNLIKKLEIENGYIRLASQLQNEISTTKKKQIPLNVDGAIAAVLCEWNWDPRIGKGVFITARAPGLCAHWLQTVIR